MVVDRQLYFRHKRSGSSVLFRDIKDVAKLDCELSAIITAINAAWDDKQNNTFKIIR